jgi:hypothetical protein
VDDKPPVTVMIRISPIGRGRIVVEGVTVDDGTIRTVRVNGREARPLAPNYLEWQLQIDAESPSGPLALRASAEDAAGNVEPTPHCATIVMP